MCISVGRVLCVPRSRLGMCSSSGGATCVGVRARPGAGRLHLPTLQLLPVFQPMGVQLRLGLGFESPTGRGVSALPLAPGRSGVSSPVGSCCSPARPPPLTIGPSSVLDPWVQRRDLPRTLALLSESRSCQERPAEQTLLWDLGPRIPDVCRGPEAGGHAANTGHETLALETCLETSQICRVPSFCFS